MNDDGQSAIAAGAEVVGIAEVKAQVTKPQQLDYMLKHNALEAEIPRDALAIAQQKVDIAHAIAATGLYPLIRIMRVLQVSRTNLYERLSEQRPRRMARLQQRSR